MIRQMDFWPDQADKRTVAFARLAYRAAVAPRPQLCEDAGAAAAVTERNAAPLGGAPHGNHGENNSWGLL